MEIEKGKTAKYLRDKQGVSSAAKENLKNFIYIKKAILTELKEGELTVPELSNKLKMPGHEVMYYLMSLLKYGYVETARVDDDDEYFYYKIKTK